MASEGLSWSNLGRKAQMEKTNKHKEDEKYRNGRMKDAEKERRRENKKKDLVVVGRW